MAAYVELLIQHGETTVAKTRKPNLKADAAYEKAHLVAQDQVAHISSCPGLPSPVLEEHRSIGQT